MHHPKGFPSRLVRLRADAEMTQKDLAKASGLSVPQIGRYEMGTSKPRMTALVKLAKALNVDVSELQDADDEPETVEIGITSAGYKVTTFTLPRSVFEDIQAEAERLGVSSEVIMVASLKESLMSEKGEAVEYDELVKQVASEYAKSDLG
ncbi:helix-turn-helix domain-containing protein [Pseudomonas alliivorans]|nr:helix-turn-helix domain-containing protein [Pseudomonas alliivorans]MEE5088373.1 helix-turn-helix domain-containing protein [Pseudomonas alliivorans]